MRRGSYLKGAKTFMEACDHRLVTPQGKSQGNKYFHFPLLHPPHLLLKLPIQQTQLEARGKEIHTCESPGTQ